MENSGALSNVTPIRLSLAGSHTFYSGFYSDSIMPDSSTIAIQIIYGQIINSCIFPILLPDLFFKNRHHPTPSGAGFGNFYWESAHFKAEGLWKLIQVA